jgi:hypothetical protein
MSVSSVPGSGWRSPYQKGMGACGQAESSNSGRRHAVGSGREASLVPRNQRHVLAGGMRATVWACSSPKGPPPTSQITNHQNPMPRHRDPPARRDRTVAPLRLQFPATPQRLGSDTGSTEGIHAETRPPAPWLGLNMADPISRRVWSLARPPPQARAGNKSESPATWAASPTACSAQATTQARMAFCTCNRFSAWSKMVAAWASKVAASISLPR